METNDKIQYDALKDMNHKYIKTYNLNALTGTLYDKYDDENKVKTALIKLDNKHDQDINVNLSANAYDDITVSPLKGQKFVLTDKGKKKLDDLTKEDSKEIEEGSNQ